jgi:hypothetical protein
VQKYWPPKEQHSRKSADVCGDCEAVRRMQVVESRTLVGTFYALNLWLQMVVIE